MFLQYNMLEGGALEPLPAPSVDTGCGLERVAALIAGVHSVYETDAFGDVIREIEALVAARATARPRPRPSRCACSPTMRAR